MSTANAGANPPVRASGSLFFVGNATVIIRYGGFTVLTDPNFLHKGQRAYLGYGLTSKRRTEPAMSAADLPADLDVIVLSHLHGDHWDRVGRRMLDRSVPILTTPHASRRLQGRQGFRKALGLRLWESHTLVKNGATLEVTALPGRHGPGLTRALLPPVMGSLLTFTPSPGDEAACRIYLSGDTLMFDGIRDIAARCPHIDLGVIHLGGTTLPGGLMVTMDGSQGCDLLDLVRPRLAVPVHYDDYEVFRSPLADFHGEVERRGLADSVHWVGRGQTVTFRPRGGRAEEGKIAR